MINLEISFSGIPKCQNGGKSSKVFPLERLIWTSKHHNSTYVWARYFKKPIFTNCGSVLFFHYTPKGPIYTPLPSKIHLSAVNSAPKFQEEHPSTRMKKFHSYFSNVVFYTPLLNNIRIFIRNFPVRVLFHDFFFSSTLRRGLGVPLRKFQLNERS